MIKINLAPPRGRKPLGVSASSSSLAALFAIATLFAVGGVGGYWWTLSAEETRLKNDIASATEELARLKAVIAEGNKFKAQRDEFERRVRAVEELTRLQPRPTYLLDAVADTIPRDLWITSASERDRLLRFNGTAFSTTAVADFMSNLKSSGRFKEVDLIVSRQDITKTPRMVTFEVVCRFEI
jgi:type IV pilus assembly protein PilN